MAEESNTSELLEKLSSNSNSNTKMRLLEARMMGHPSPVETSKGSPTVKDLSTMWEGAAGQQSPARVDEASTNSDSEEDVSILEEVEQRHSTGAFCGMTVWWQVRKF